MAGIRKRKSRNGKPLPGYQGWYTDWQGKQRYFKGTSSPKETQAIATRLEEEHRLIRLGHLPPPSQIDDTRTFAETMEEYIAWGEAQGGHGGHPWGETHARMRRSFLVLWERHLKIKTLADLKGILPRVEKALRELKSKGRTGKTLRNYADGLAAFCDWCKKRDYLVHDPLEKLQPFDATPQTKRRALSPDEIQRLLAACQPNRKLTYEMAICTGLRAGELQALRVSHLDLSRGGVQLEAAWTKNRKAGFQPLPKWLLDKLVGGSLGKAKTDSLVYVPACPARDIEIDLDAAGIAKWTDEGKVDFYALRVAYVSLVFEAGASTQEAQTLARHSTPDLTLNVYARARETRLAEVAEKVGENIRPGHNHDTSTDEIQVTGRSQHQDSENLKIGNSRLPTDLTVIEEWSGRRDSNPRPLGPKPSALNRTALRPERLRYYHKFAWRRHENNVLAAGAL